MKFILSFITLFLFSTALALPLPSEVAFMLNKGDVHYAPMKLGDQVVLNKVQTIKCNYSFAKQGGTIATVKKLKATDGADCVIPDNAIVIKVLVDAYTTVTSGGSATLSLGIPGAVANLKASTAVASFTGIMDGVPAYTAATAVKMTANAIPQLTIGTAALTAGAFNVYISYVLGD